MRLYEWNAAVSAAFWESLSFLEVGLRNAIDSELTSIHEGKGRAGHWIFDDAKEDSAATVLGHASTSSPIKMLRSR